jgi:histone acetyltransferase 1
MSNPSFEEWTVRVSEVFTVALTKNGLNLFEPFEVPYSEFIPSEQGLADTVVGYKRPHAAISFRASDLAPSVNITFQAKLGDFNINLGGIKKIPEIKDLLLPFLPDRAWDTTVEPLPADWTPPGKKVHSYTFEGDQFEIWQSKLSDPRTYQLIQNMVILIPMFIESGTIGFLEDDEQSIAKWSIYLLYQHKDQDYTFAGLSTTHRFDTAIQPETPPPFSLPDLQHAKSVCDVPEPDSFDEIFSSTEAPSVPRSARERISQFLLLPPFQHKPHGINLYNFIYDQLLADPVIFEITVEDPNEQFDNLRDYADYTRLLRDPLFSSTHPISSTTTPISKKVPLTDLLPANYHQTLRRAYKMISRQVERLTEMHILRQIPQANRSRTRIIARGANSAQENDRKYYFWRLLVKARVAKRNAEGLGEIEDKGERIDRLESTVDSMQEGYVETLEGWEKRVERGYLVDPEQQQQQVGLGGERTLVNGKGKGKRRRILDEDSESEGSVSKRQATEPIAID